MSKKNKKNLKKVHAKIDNTPVKPEGAKKEESVAPATKELRKAKREARANLRMRTNPNGSGSPDKYKDAKKAHEEAKYAASKARIEARNARKKERVEELAGIKKEKEKEAIKITFEDRKNIQENCRKVAYNRHISSVRRRCKRMKLSDEQTNAIVEKAKSQWDAAKQYDLVIVYESSPKKKAELEKLVKDARITSALITGSTAFFRNVPKDAVDKIRELLAGDAIYQYRVDKDDLFKDYEMNHTPKKPSGNKNSHSRQCSKNLSINFYNLRKAKKKAKETLEKNTYAFRHGSKAEGRKLRRGLKAKAKPVNKKPTQVKEIKSKSNKQAA